MGLLKRSKRNPTPLKEQSEDSVISDCRAYLSLNGWSFVTLYTGGIPSRGGKRIKNPAKGIPDCLLFNYSLNKMIWVEFKKSNSGIVSNEQKAWHIQLRQCGQTVFLVNSLESLITQLEEIK